MLRSLFLLVVAAAACSPGDRPENSSATAQRSAAAKEDRANTAIVAPAGAPAGEPEIYGATPGPCGSTRAEAFLGRQYSSELDTALIRATGASQVRVAREDNVDVPPDPRRLNVALDDYGRIVLLDCG